ncbi:TonB-dependent receptor [Synoicihabitans lomoniglobus]|uniref:TonB-dependent receptor n=1 Tax=Synoicihabitans lomoniglobus TaxID=2909285 RepID=A0AAF0CG88_9BACT|nr:TonB-dependent receptor [Opitutaceae bacterium LMO-M01]WED63287.1 TonB-dependent receptor [Opitutaceae bacterium LMO-M01]
MFVTTPSLGKATALPQWSVPSRCLITVLLFGLFSTLLSAQSGSATIEGRVSNAITGNYLTNARVTVVDSGKSVFTNSYGEYRISGLPEGEVNLEVFYTGLDRQSATVSTSGGKVSRNFALTNAAQYGEADDDTVLLDAFTVQATEQANDAIAINEQRFASSFKNVVSADAFGDVTEGNPGEFLKFLPGIAVDYVAADVRSVNVRGFGSSFTSVSVDGNRMASAASSGDGRNFELEQVSMNNVSRIEVVKVPTPSMPADSLGGSVNMVSKNAFERDAPEFKYRVYTSVSSENLSLGESPGPGVENSRKIRPGFDFSYSNPLSANFGFIINGLYSNQFNEQHRSRTAWQTSGGGASTANPYLRTYTIQDGPKETKRQSIGVNADWKVSENGVLSFGYQWNDYRSFFGNRNYNFGAGSNLTDFSPNHTNGIPGRGEISHGMSHRHKFGTTNHLNLDYKFYRDDLEIKAGAYYSHATNEYDDITEGHFSGVTIRAKNLDIDFGNVGVAPDQAPTMAVYDANGNAFDWQNLDNYYIDEVRSNPRDSWDEFVGGNLDVTKSFDRFKLQVGVATRNQERDILRRNNDYEFVGADGVQGNDSPAQFADEIYTDQDPFFGFDAPVYVDPRKVYAYFLANPDHFVAQTANWSDRVKADYNLEERVDSAYVQGEVKLMEGQARFITGLRYEKTSLDGLGYLYLPDGDKDANGNFLSNDPYTRERLKWLPRAQSHSSSYDGVYPSAHFIYDVNENFLVRLGYAKTIGRPNFSNVLPGTEINHDDAPAAGDPGGDITVRNPALKPYTANNFDLSLEYYFRPAGVFSVGVFHKDVSDFFGSIAKFVDEDDLDTYNLDPSLLGYNLSTKVNSGDAKISGVEFNYVQQLTKLPGIWSNLSIFANATKLDLDGGVTADWNGFIEELANWGISYSGQRFTAKVNWNYRGQQFRSFRSGLGTNGAEYYEDRLYLDLNFGYKFSKRFAVFLNARNVTNQPQVLQRYGDEMPGYAHNYQQEEFAVQYAFGIKGTF